MSEPMRPTKRVRQAFDRAALKRVCEMHETDFAKAYSMVETEVDQPKGSDFYLHLDRGSNILAVAHLDTVVKHSQRLTNFVETAAGPVVHSGALDDRLGAYTILELLPLLGVNVDVLLTVGEEQGMSTASFFDTSKDYNWMIEFDRGGTDVVMYDYDEEYLRDMVRECGARVGNGSFSDIAFMEHLGKKGFNWGVGYQDYHSVRGHAYLEDYWMMVGHFLKFHETWHDTELPHEESRFSRRGRGSSSWSYGGNDWWGDDKYTSAYDWDTDDKPETMVQAFEDRVLIVASEYGIDSDELREQVFNLGLTSEDATLEDVLEAADFLSTDEDPDEVVSEDFNIVNERLLALEVGPSARASV